jgi:hypothetical protein
MVMGLFKTKTGGGDGVTGVDVFVLVQAKKRKLTVTRNNKYRVVERYITCILYYLCFVMKTCNDYRMNGSENEWQTGQVAGKPLFITGG